jgi:2-polyprenyl-6-methoxyphenol hydroxylase-like FAD-dependent oxidoreductase
VLIAGGGPAGMTLAAELGWRGVECLIVEERDGPVDHPRATLLGARSMEHYRRWGLAEDVIAASLPLDYPIEIVFTTRLCGFEIFRFSLTTMGEFMAHPPELADSLPDARWSPYYKTQIGQQALEPVIAEFADSFDGVDVRYGWRFEDFTSDETGVTATIRDVASGRPQTIRASYLAGCDGGRSLVRSKLGIRYGGRGAMRANVSFYFRSSRFLATHELGRGTLYWTFAPGSCGVFTAIDGHELWNYQHYFLDASEPTAAIDPNTAIRDGMGRDFPFEVLRTTHWSHHQSVAERYRSGRVFLAGDSAHLFAPTGGFGMNTGIGDAVDLGWKLAGLFDGWAGSALLDSYEAERRPIAVRNTLEAASNADRIDGLMRATPPEVEADSEAGARLRGQLASNLQPSRKTFSAGGIHLGYCYGDSPIVVSESGTPPKDDPQLYQPSSWPGARAPHAWRSAGISTLDWFGRGFTLVASGEPIPQLAPLEREARRVGLPLEVVTTIDPELCALYERRLVLVRPDGHVAWRGDALPDDVRGLVDAVRGAGSELAAAAASGLRS